MADQINGAIGEGSDFTNLKATTPRAWVGRDKDRAFCIGLLQHAFVKLVDALAMVRLMPLDEKQQQTRTRRIKRWAA
ncbi:hypothetical protein [Aquabacterium sp.]|uniref:hypothetical protein n=1 Tax=Aquabacterium sp. TaxID=1872578 RepID=UPI00248A250B|nr:hypothetical protein [Aquabacterium sp.]MDI1257713.1 hypothetical protein [Aquabacterium sp.]